MRVSLPVILGGALVALVAGGAMIFTRGESRADRRAGSPEAGEAEGDATEPGATAGRQRDYPVGSWQRPRIVGGAPRPFEASAAAPTAREPPPRYEADAAAAAARERNLQVDAIRASGPEAGALLRSAQEVGRSWERLTSGGAADVHVGSWECYKVGCFVPVLHRSDESYEDLTSKILNSPEMANWSGPKTRSAPVRKPDGSVEVTWILFASPDGGQPRDGG